MKDNKSKQSMIEPGISSLLEKVDSRYTLVVATAKRARQLTDGAHKLTDCQSDKPVTVAINEIDENKITYIRTKSGIK
ncbi:DNA-directed RNA polymerase subunit omega [Acetivibrio clariflavus]|uniref:DNA-directed RNA polymerase subunit omega n=1 Tax=Acetivibrio clariflavus (strain DSM 19732 / NBRC 101661 / EBR45) TaxID=720554 RepID=G8M302_ACECE|nr:DNA-directed RNA polymerase subunit omega [Acetivibrio clariflavus]AEV69311.1 DNA-directed RNA polymerase subunit omega [Acetivibrio clariflavus DSM 19732]